MQLIIHKQMFYSTLMGVLWAQTTKRIFIRENMDKQERFNDEINFPLNTGHAFRHSRLSVEISSHLFVCLSVKIYLKITFESFYEFPLLCFL